MNADYEIRHLSGSAARFLQLRGGEPTSNLLQLVHPMLRVELRALLFRAAQTGETAEAFRVPLEREGKQIELSMERPPDPRWIDGDAIRLQQILWNLLRTAAKFTPERGRVRRSAAGRPRPGCGCRAPWRAAGRGPFPTPGK